MDNKSSNSIQIKVENEANIDYGNVSQYEEFKVMPYAACKQEEEKHISNNEEEEFEFILENDETQLSNDSLNNSREFQAAKNVNCHTRRTMVSHFLKHGWSGKSYRDICKRVTEEKVDDYGTIIRRIIRDAQQYVYQECDSLCFGNISEWLEVFKTMKVPENSFYEPAIIVNAIVNNEKLPDPKDVGGVNLKSIYSFLCRGLMGLPQVQMDPISAKFLANEFETLIEEANSEFADSQTLLLKQKIERTLAEKMNQVPPSLDPFWLTEGTIVHSAVLENKADEITTTSKGKNAKKENNKRINSTKNTKTSKKAKLENTDISVSCEDYKTGITTSESTINSASPSVYDGEAVTKTEKPSTETVLKNPKNELVL